ncbi:Poly(A) polymerase [Rhynchospora pubera]|uniref:Poly(A) polymerase n=1 Tax=Rhynchospora pubera TaxID=906938 RepID=A0AAV8GYA1_9POAL|nr:Poly(A) polymerase [Rhynchospora pubera]
MSSIDNASEASGSSIQNAVKQYGITNPVSLPTNPDLQRLAELEKFLAEAGLYESEEETTKRQEVLLEIERICKEWVKQFTLQRGYTDQMVEEANVVIFTFGSYRLGVHGPGDDLETLCVGPSYVNRGGLLNGAA